jgi:Ca2+-transporting ATPase
MWKKDGFMSNEVKQSYLVGGIAIDPEVGLTDVQVKEMRGKFGENALTPPERTPWWQQFIGKFDDPTIKILLAAAIISLIMAAVEKYALNDPHATFVDSLGIFMAVTLATVVGFLSERKSEKEFDLLNEVKEAIDVKVTRNGVFHTITIKDIVVGDVLRLDMGDKVPADGVLFSSLHLYIDESLLTGESLPAQKSWQADGTDIEMASDDNRVFRGTMVADGHGQYLVTAVGDSTKMGEIARALAHTEGEDKEEETPLKQKLTRLAKQISVVGVIASTLIFTVMGVKSLLSSDLFRQVMGNIPVLSIICILAIVLGIILMKYVLKGFFSSMDMEMKSKEVQALAVVPMTVASFIFLVCAWGFLAAPLLSVVLLNELLVAFVVAVTIIVVAVPEGLPMMVTVSLALNMMKMAKENCLVRRLIASETIGSATVICTDKTGTLTQNKMKPVWFFIGMKSFEAKEIHAAAETPEWDGIIRNIAVNSEAQLEIKEEGMTGVGNPTECALLLLLHEKGIDYREMRRLHPKIWQIDYNSERKQSVVMVEVNGKQACYVKGAPERVLENCTHVSIAGKLEPIENYRTDILAALHTASTQALRVIAFSEKYASAGCSSLSDISICMNCEQRVFLGLVGIADPLRPEVPGAVSQCGLAGIEVKMITGDALQTAKAIAIEAGILHPGELVMTSKEFNEVSDEDLPTVAKDLRVLARSSPLDKYRLVQALHKIGAVVAMTGDGTNDAPALKTADVGLSMGKAGTEVAKEASDIVLLDDNFKSILTGVWWGRTLYQNIQRFLQFQLSVNVVALLSALIGPMVGWPLPLTVPQLLWVNIIMDTFAALALSTDPPRLKTMLQPPISRSAHIITPAMAVNIGIVGLYQVAVLFFVLIADPFKVIVFDQFKVIDPEKNILMLSVFFTTFIMFQFWNIFNCRTLRHDESPLTLITKNKMFITIVTFIIIVQVVMVQVGGPVGDIFRTTPLKDPMLWLKIVGLTATVVPVAWLARQIAHWIGAEGATIQDTQSEESEVE